MKKLTVITCFSYSGNKKYVFNPDCLRSDLRRIFSFSQNKFGCKLENVHIVTDIIPDIDIRNEINWGFQIGAKRKFRKLGYSGQIVEDLNQLPLNWLSNMCHQVGTSLRKSASSLYRYILDRVPPVIRNSNIVEYASLFTQFTLISGANHYDQILNRVFLQLDSTTKLLFYYTGHGVRHWETQNGIDQIKDIRLVIPKGKGQVDYYSRNYLRRIFSNIPIGSGSFIVFDCCHAESMIDLPLKITFNNFGQPIFEGSPEHQQPEIVFLASTQNDQTCGFYMSSRECGSIFTYYLTEFLSSCNYNDSKRFSQLYSSVEARVHEYRVRAKKPSQNMLIRLSQNISKIPVWLFDNSKPRLIEEKP